MIFESLQIDDSKSKQLGQGMLRLLVLVVAFQVSGFSGPGIQVIGWSSMLGEALRNHPLVVAVSDTFSGERACARCHAAILELADKHHDSGQLPAHDENKPVLGFTLLKAWILSARKQVGTLVVSGMFAEALDPAPLTPPPRW